eukprot:CAMPEP_0198695856 /NCGR_PEP_ID=MMETSP1468-20131203/295615_1 /TAXON_ID=1461545 /ORGANISM="Mantoniella sp, Strain CCMP1436" /LENGTH=67 /DNA_ID=CAMNT_0044451791 /DNA_START=44 /DNA_END=244 /DNA_ORIENTATION=+
MGVRNEAEWDTVQKGESKGSGNYNLTCKLCGAAFKGSGARISAHIAGGFYAVKGGVSAEGLGRWRRL